MQFPVTRFLSAALLATASLTAGAQTLLTQIPLDSFSGDAAAIDVAVNSATNRVYVPIQFIDWASASQSVSTYNYFRLLVVNGATNQVVHNVTNFPSGSYYLAIAIDPIGNFTYVEMGNGPYFAGTQCTVSVVDGRTEEIVKTISLPYNECGRMVVDPVTGNVYIRSYDAILVIGREASGSVEYFPAYEECCGEPRLAVSPYVHRLYFTEDAHPEGLGLFDTLNDHISYRAIYDTAGVPATNFVVNPATGHIFGSNVIYSGDTSYNEVTVFDSSGDLLATIIPPVGDQENINLTGMDVDPKTNLTFVFASTFASDGSGTALYVIDGANNTLLKSTTLTLPGFGPVYGGSVSLNPDTSKVYVAFNYSRSPTSKVNGSFYLNVYSEQ